MMMSFEARILEFRLAWLECDTGKPTYANPGAIVDVNLYSVDPESVRRAMRQWATGVTVVGASHGGIRRGMTVSSFTSISLDPPLVMVSIGREARTHGLIASARSFGVTILGADQQEISDRFAGRLTEDEDRFAGLDSFTLATGAPFLNGGLAFIDSRVHTTLEAGTSTVFVGEVVALKVGDAAQPLIYYQRGYHCLD